MGKSNIEWTESTWNPVTGCTKVSDGCKNCYAEVMHKRLNAMGTKGYENPFNKVTCHLSRLRIPLKIKKPTTFFVNSMSDLFHKDVPTEFIDKIMNVIYQCLPIHKFQILTKRPRRMHDYFRDKGCYGNIHAGMSVCGRKDINDMVTFLMRSISSDVKFPFLSIEPLLEDLGEIPFLDVAKWIIIGGESGPKARPMKKEWALNIINQCKQQNVPVFFKQWGAYGEDGIKRSKKKNGFLIDGKEYRDAINNIF